MTAQRKDDLEVATGEVPEGGPVGTPPVRTETSDATWGGAADAVRLPPIDPARYQVLREFARGGLGRIIEVHDLRLGRVVALKEMLRDGEVAYARFVREAMITARLEHPAIVPVHDIGRWPSGEAFYAMKLISGRSLHDVILDTPVLDGRLALLPNVIAVADAIAYAHSQRIIHRDLKPANVLVGAFGETVVIDWGLAKDLRAAGDGEAGREPEGAGGDLEASAGERSLTVAGAVLGTPCYMPPEQARGQPVDERADVYALGALLYEVLAGEPPYRGAVNPLTAVLAGPPEPVEGKQPAIPPDLGAIVRKAMARGPDDRYPSARELVLDLRRFQTGRLVSAHVYSRRMLVKRWLRRYRVPVVVAAVALSILAAVGAVSVDRVVAERDVARRRTNQLLLTQARGVLERDATEALMWLRTYPDDGEDQVEMRALAIEAESRGVARHIPPRDGFFTFTADGLAWVGAEDGEHIDLHDAASGARVGRWLHRGHVQMILAVPDSHTVAILDQGDTAVTLLDLGTGNSRRLPGHPGIVSRLAVSPDGRWIASGSSDGLVRIAPTGPGEGRALRGHEGEIEKVAFSRDGRWLLSMASERAAARLWQIDGGEVRTLTGPRDVLDGDVSADGALVAFAHPDGDVSLWSAATGAQLPSPGRHAGKASKVVFSPDGRWLASIGDDGDVLVTSVATGAQRTLSGHKGAVAGIAFSPDSTRLASGGSDGEVRLWQVDGDEERVLGRHPGRVFYLAFSPDGRRLATRTLAQGEWFDARIWDVAMLRQRGLRCHRAAVFQVVFSPDGRRMATGSEDHSVCLWDPRTGEGQRLEGHDASVYSLAFAPDGSRLASASFDGTLRVWELGACGASVAGCQPVSRVLAGHQGGVWMTAFSPDGRWLASTGADATVRLWNMAGGQARVLAGHTRVVRAVAFSQDGRHLASAGEEPDVRLWGVPTGIGAPLHGHEARVTRLAFSSDAHSLWTASADQTVRVWDLATGESRVVARRLGRAPAFALPPGAGWIAVGDAEGRVILVDPVTLAERVLGRHAAPVYRLAFSPDGRWLASAGIDHTVRLWDVEREDLEAVFQNEFEVRSIAFSPDGRTIAAAGSGPVVRIWPIPSRGAVPGDRRGLAAWMATLSTASLDPHGRAP
ncbi:MAG TPA: protein kinase [Kofleriaceae bacterium]